MTKHVYVVQRGQLLGDEVQWVELAVFKTSKLADNFVKKLEHVIPESHKNHDWIDGYAKDEEYEFSVIEEEIIADEKPIKKLVKEWDWK